MGEIFKTITAYVTASAAFINLFITLQKKVETPEGDKAFIIWLYSKIRDFMTKRLKIGLKKEDHHSQPDKK